MYTSLLAFVALASARTTLLPAETRTRTTLEKRFTPPPSSTVTGTYICKDYFDDCGNTFGPGCFTSFHGSPDPTFATLLCPTTTRIVERGIIKTETVVVDGHTVTNTVTQQAPVTPTPTSVGGTFICKDYFDRCGNTYGPGCYTSHSDYPEPSYTTPVCTVTGAVERGEPGIIRTETVVADGHTITETVTQHAPGPVKTPQI